MSKLLYEMNMQELINERDHWQDKIDKSQGGASLTAALEFRDAAARAILYRKQLEIKNPRGNVTKRGTHE